MIKSKIAVYTVITGEYDDLKVPMYYEQIREQADFICFTDQDIESSIYDIRSIEPEFENNILKSRYPKINAHKYLKNYRYSIYIDANLLLIANDLYEIIDKYLSACDIARFIHHTRNCIYKEAEVCKIMKLDEPEVIDDHMRRYQDEGFPREFGLGANCFIIRRHTVDVSSFNEIWWSEYVSSSKRDQLSFDYVRWKTGIKTYSIPMFWKNNQICVRFDHNKDAKQAIDKSLGLPVTADLKKDGNRSFASRIVNRVIRIKNRVVARFESKV